MKRSQLRAYQQTAASALQAYGFPATVEQIEIADFGLGRFEKEGLALLMLVNEPTAYCGKLLLMRPWQLCPTHRHPPIPERGNYAGKQETFVCLRGEVRLAVEGQQGRLEMSRPINGQENGSYPDFGACRLGPGEKATIPRNTWHWFEATAQGALILELSTPSYDIFDIFMDRAVIRSPAIEEDCG